MSGLEPLRSRMTGASRSTESTMSRLSAPATANTGKASYGNVRGGFAVWQVGGNCPFSGSNWLLVRVLAEEGLLATLRSRDASYASADLWPT